MKHIRLSSAAALIAATFSLGACGNDPGERALSGGGIGAGAGALGAAVLGVNPVTGALVGGAVGAATGAATSSDQIDLDRNRRDRAQDRRDRAQDRRDEERYDDEQRDRDRYPR